VRKKICNTSKNIILTEVIFVLYIHIVYSKTNRMSYFEYVTALLQSCLTDFVLPITMINVKNADYKHTVNVDGSKTAKITKRQC